MAGCVIDQDAVQAARLKFDELHQQHYTFSLPEAAVELVSFNLTAYGMVPKPEVNKLPARGRALSAAIKGERDVLFEEYGKQHCLVYDRALLEPGHEFCGPAIVEESKSVTVLCPKQRLTVDGYGNLIIYNTEV